MPEPQVIEVYADLWCPFAYVGLIAASTTCEAFGGDLQLLIRSWPLELVNHSPLPEAKTQANAHALGASVAPQLFAGVDRWAYPTSTLAALGLAAQATAQQGALGRTVSMHLRHLLFEEGRDLSRSDVLDQVAADFGLQTMTDEQRRHLVMNEFADGQRRGVKGSPHFFCDGGAEIFCPTLDLSRDDEGTLHVRSMVDRLHDFFTDCSKT